MLHMLEKNGEKMRENSIVNYDPTSPSFPIGYVPNAGRRFTVFRNETERHLSVAEIFEPDLTASTRSGGP